MVYMGHLLAVAAMIIAAASAGPLVAGQSAGDDCSSICNDGNTTLENSACYSMKLDDGTCHAVYVNTAVARLDIDNEEVDTASLAQTSGSPPADGSPIIARSLFEKGAKPTLICMHYSSPTCMKRGKGANMDDCGNLARFWNGHYGRWVFEGRDFAGRHWLNLMTSGNCVFAVGNPQSATEFERTYLGNSDITNVLSAGTSECRGGDGLEAQGTMDCKKWPLHYWIGSMEHFNCCTGEDPPNPK